jgi:hypothetical protein
LLRGCHAFAAAFELKLNTTGVNTHMGVEIFPSSNDLSSTANESMFSARPQEFIAAVEESSTRVRNSKWDARAQQVGTLIASVLPMSSASE